MEAASSVPGELDAVLSKLKKTFNHGKTKPLEYRQYQLRQLVAMLEENRKCWKDALGEDMGRCDFEAELCELVPIISEAQGTHNDLRDWMKPEKAKTGAINAMDNAFVQREPLGLCLIISSWNYPIQYTLRPLIGAIAAGNVVVIKASEKCVSTTRLLKSLFPRYLDNDSYAVVVGGADSGVELLRRKFDFVFFTGKRETGREIVRAVAEHLTPVSLHLGGKNPVYVDTSVDADKVARSIIWGKMMNAGQNCAAPDYVLCRKEVHKKFLEAIKKTLGNFYGSDPKASPNFGRIINLTEWTRVVNLIDQEKVVLGGQTDEADLYIAPTVMTNVTPSDTVMQSEIFGPVLPIIAVGSVQEAVAFIGKRPKPLAVYAFSKENSVLSHFQEMTSSGGYCGNDVLSHLSLSTLPNGGVGASGSGGAYHGFFGFDTFSNRKAVLIKKLALEGTLAPRYPPYTESHLNTARNALKKKFKLGKEAAAATRKDGGDESD